MQGNSQNKYQIQQLLSWSISTLKEQETKKRKHKIRNRHHRYYALTPQKRARRYERTKDKSTCQKKLKLYDNTHSLSHYPKVDVNQPPATYQIIPSLVKTIQ